jgi:hypothetical protein
MIPTFGAPPISKCADAVRDSNDLGTGIPGAQVRYRTAAIKFTPVFRNGSDNREAGSARRTNAAIVEGEHRDRTGCEESCETRVPCRRDPPPQLNKTTVEGSGDPEEQ